MAATAATSYRNMTVTSSGMKHFSTAKSLLVIRARRKVGLFLFLQENELTDHSGILPLKKRLYFVLSSKHYARSICLNG